MARVAGVSKSSQIGKSIAPPRFLMFLALFAGGLALLKAWDGLPLAHSALLAFDAAAWVFLLSLWPLLKDAKAEQMRAHANANDAGRVLVLILTAIVGAVVLVAVGVELSAKDRSATDIALVLGTLMTSWLFGNVIYALHYAHLFYGKRRAHDGQQGGLDFPGTKEPDYHDFFYFAATMGMTFQTSDVAITSAKMRRVAIWHGLVAFIFNMGIIAFTINILGGR